MPNQGARRIDLTLGKLGQTVHQPDHGVAVGHRPFAEPLCANAVPKLAAPDTMGHQAACYMAIPGSGHSRAPAKERDTA